MAVNFPDSPANGDSFSVNDTTYVYNATAGYWDITSTVQASASTSTNAPSNPSSGDLWFDPSSLTTYIYYSDGTSSQWVPANSVGARGAPGPGYPTAYYSVDYTSTATGNVVFNSSSSPTLPSYTVGKVNAWVNGVLRSDIDASDGSNVEISLSTGDEVQIINFGDTDILDPTASSNDHTTYTTLSSLIDTVQANVTSAGSGVAVYATPDLLPLSGTDAGDQAYVNSTNRLYINNGAGWYSIGLVNSSPSITSVLDGDSNATPFTLSTDGSASVITITATDPEDVPLTYTYSVTSGSLTNGGGTTATIVQGTGSNTNKFTVTPSTTEAYAGTFSLTFTASDGINTATSANSFTLNFITTITNSNYTTLLATATPKNTTVYRYFKFLPQAMRSATPDAMQYSEFELTDGTSYYSPSSASQLYRADDTDGDDYVANQRVAASIDGSTSTKLYNGGWASKYYLYDMGASFNTVLTGWRYITGDDVDGRDPVSWTLLGSTNNSDWVLLDQRVNETITTSRSTATQDFTFNATNQAFFNAANTNYPIEVNGDAHAGTFSPYRSGGYSTYFDGNDYLTTTQTTPLGTTDFTIEGWINFDNVGGNRTFITLDDSAQLYFRNSGSSIAIYGISGGTYNFSTGTPEINTWYHFAFVRQSGSITLYWDGQSKGSVGCTDNFSSGNLHIGCWSAISEFFQGHLTDIKISNTAVYTSNFSVPTERLSSDSSTKLLICHLPYIADGSNLNETIAVNGNPSTKPFSPYDYLEYDVADHGGAINFDGTGDYLTIPDHSSLNFSSNDWTIECWIYPRTNVGDCGIWHQSASGGTDWFSLYLDGSFNPKFVLRNNNAEEWAGTAAANTAPQNTWTHIALVRRFGTDIKLYANGKVVHTETQHLNVALENKTYNHVIGYERFVGNGTYFDGLISDFKMDIGTAHYTAEFTPPTAPLSSSGAELHIKGTDASIVDKSQGSNLKLIGNTTVSTTQVKFTGSKSMYFDGTGDYLLTSTPALGTGDWTIEGWVYFNSIPTQYIFDFRLGTNTNPALAIASDWVYISGNNQHIQSGVTPSINTWYHFAIVKNSGTTTLYIDGSSIGTFSDSLNYLGNSESTVGNYNAGGNYYLNGYLEDFRVTKGLARYTANFTPPTASLEG